MMALMFHGSHCSNGSSGKRKTDTAPIGTVGTLVQDDGSDVPFEVRFSASNTGWYAKDELEHCEANVNFDRADERNDANVTISPLLQTQLSSAAPDPPEARFEVPPRC